MGPTLILLMRITVGSRKLAWPTILGLFSIVAGRLRPFRNGRMDGWDVWMDVDEIG